MVKLSDFEAKFCAININLPLAMALYLYNNPAYFTIYNIIGFYKNYLNQSKIVTYNQFNKAILKLYIKIKHDFAIYENF